MTHVNNINSISRQLIFNDYASVSQPKNKKSFYAYSFETIEDFHKRSTSVKIFLYGFSKIPLYYSTVLWYQKHRENLSLEISFLIKKFQIIYIFFSIFHP